MMHYFTARKLSSKGLTLECSGESLKDSVTNLVIHVVKDVGLVLIKEPIIIISTKDAFTKVAFRMISLKASQ